MREALLTAVVFCLTSFGQTGPVSMVGVQFRIGMAKDVALSKLATDPNVKLNAMSDDWYIVMTRRLDTWEQAGDLTFRGGKLSRISVDQWSTNEQAAAQFAKAAYSAVSAGGTPIELWTATNGDAMNPAYEIHVIFKDREIVISTTSVGNVEVSDVRTYFPRRVRAEK
jgi:hypothetical protein